MTLTFWQAANESQGDDYSIRTQTRRECLAELAELPEDLRRDYAEPVKVIMTYSSGFELMRSCLGENRGWDLVANIDEVLK